MLITLTLRLEAFHKPSEQWHIHETPWGVRAVSVRHALNKGLKIVASWPGYTDRAGHPDWDVTAHADLRPQD